MKKSFLFASAVALVALSSCSNDGTGITEDNKTDATENVPVAIGTYVQGQTRAYNVDLDDVQEHGFGVFAFSQGTDNIATYVKENYTPDFMYNQKVSCNEYGTWTYSPVKYWPNNPGAMVSFYAYAPYEAQFDEDDYTLNPDNSAYLVGDKYTTKHNTRLQLSSDSKYPGPCILYALPDDPTEGVDLLWGANSDAGADEPIAPVNIQKQTSDEQINFMFRHALSRLHFNVQVWNDEKSEEDNKVADDLTRSTYIKINKVELVGNMAKRGTLRLYNGTWKISTDDLASITFEGDQLNPAVDSITYGDAHKEIDLLKGTSQSTEKKGATEQLDEEEIDNYVMAIPTGQFYIRITYTVTTIDKRNPKNSSVVTNTVSSNDTNAVIEELEEIVPAMENQGKNKGLCTLEQGKAYEFHLNIGLTSVKFEAEVENWKCDGNEVSLPDNDK